MGLIVALLLSALGASSASPSPVPASAVSADWYRAAASYVQSQQAYALLSLRNSRQQTLTPDEQRTLLAMLAVRYVSNRMSPLRYGALAEIEGSAPKTTDEAIANGAGICGNHVEAALTLLRALGFQARSVQFYREGPAGNESHIVVEVLIGGSWRMLDVTWRAWFQRAPNSLFELVSTAELEARGRSAFTSRRDTAAISSIVANAAGTDVLGYLDPWPNKVILRGQSGVIDLAPDVAKLEWVPREVPNFIGRTLDHGELAEGTVEIVLHGAGRAHGLRFLDATQACRAGRIIAQTAADGVVGEVGLQELAGGIKFRRSPHPGEDISLSLRGPRNEPCYVVYGKILPS